MARRIDAHDTASPNAAAAYRSDVIASMVRLVALCMNADFQGDIMASRADHLPMPENRDIALVYAIATNPPLRPSALAANTAQSAYSVSRGLARLAAAGIIERLADQSDARASLVRFTPDGERLAAHLFGAGDELADAIMRDWSDADRQRFEQLLHQFVDTLAERAGSTASTRG